MQLNPKQISYLRGLAHHLNPVVMVGNNGLSEAVLKEVDVNLKAHELIKIKVQSDEKAVRAQMLDNVCATLGCTPVHHIGKNLVVYRASDTVKESAKIVIPK